MFPRAVYKVCLSPTTPPALNITLKKYMHISHCYACLTFALICIFWITSESRCFSPVS